MATQTISDLELLDKIYTKLFEEATPQVSYKKLKRLAKEGVLQFGWWQEYYLDQDRQDEIVQEICDKFKCSPKKKVEILAIVALGYSPVGDKQNWLGLFPEEKAPICPTCGRVMKQVPAPYIGWVCPSSEVWQAQEKSRKGRK